MATSKHLIREVAPIQRVLEERARGNKCGPPNVQDEPSNDDKPLPKPKPAPKKTSTW